MKVRYKAGAVTAEERAEVDAWIEAHRSEDIDLITIGVGAAGVYGAPGRSSQGVSGIAIRYPGRLADTLDRALASLRERSTAQTTR